eukprot:tig00020592_g11644.t1
MRPSTSASPSALGSPSAGGRRFAERLSDKLDFAVELQRAHEAGASAPPRRAPLAHARLKAASSAVFAASALSRAAGPGAPPAARPLEPVAPLPSRDGLPSELSPALATAAAYFWRKDDDGGTQSDSELLVRRQAGTPGEARRRKHLRVLVAAGEPRGGAGPGGSRGGTPQSLSRATSSSCFAPPAYPEAGAASPSESSTPTTSLRSLAGSGLAPAPSARTLTPSPSRTSSLRSLPPLPGPSSSPSPSASLRRGAGLPLPAQPSSSSPPPEQPLIRPDVLPKYSGSGASPSTSSGPQPQPRRLVSFLETGFLKPRPSYTRYEVKELSEIFDRFNTAKTGEISKLEITAILTGRREAVPEDWRHLAEDLSAIISRNPHKHAIYFDDLLRAVYPWVAPDQVALMLRWAGRAPDAAGAGPAGAQASGPPPERRRQLTKKQLAEVRMRGSSNIRGPPSSSETIGLSLARSLLPRALHCAQVRALFDLYDTERNGVLSHADFMRAGAATGLSPAELDALFARYDDDSAHAPAPAPVRRQFRL